MRKGILTIIIAIFLLMGERLMAQPTGDPEGDPDATPVNLVPLDGGVSFLLAAGIIYGAKKVFTARKLKINNLTREE